MRLLCILVGFSVCSSAAVYPPEELLGATRACPITPLPAYLTPFTDPVRGTRMQRITETTAFGTTRRVMKHSYAKNQPWNADGSLIFLGDRYPCDILDGRTYARLKTIHQPSFAVWSNLDPNSMYGTYSGTNNFVKTDVRTDWTTTVVRTFSEFDSIDMGGGEGNLSNDDRYVALFGFSGSDTSLVVYDLQQDVIVGRKSFGNVTAGGGTNADLNNCTMSQSGSFVLMQITNAFPGHPAGVEVYDRQLNFLRRVADNPGGHLDVGYDTQGHEVIVGQGIQERFVNDRALKMARLDVDDAVTVVLESDQVNWAIHASCRNLKRPGWAYLSEFAYQNADPSNYVNFPIHNELLAIKLDGSLKVQKFGQEHHAPVITEAEYERAPMAVPNRDGSVVLWASDWHDTSVTSPIHTYVAWQPFTAADLTRVRQQFGRSGSAISDVAADVDGNGKIDAADIATVTRGLAP
jgi:hypothetical protein